MKLKLRNSLQWLGIGVLICYTCLPKFAQAQTDWLELEIHQTDLIRQGEAECGPAALFNSFIIGNENLKASMDKLKGQTKEEKFRDFMKRFALKKSEINPDRPKWDRGMDSYNLYFMTKDFLRLSKPDPAVQFFEQSLVRRPEESYGTLLDRFEGLVRASLMLGVPPILDIQKYEGNYAFDYKAGAKDKSQPTATNSVWWTTYSFAGGHFVTIYGIRRISAEKIEIKVFDQDAYRSHTLEISEETQFEMGDAYDNSAHVKIDHRDDTFRPLSSKSATRRINTPSGQVNSPVLILNSTTYWEPVGETPPSDWPAPPFPGIEKRNNAPPVYFSLYHFIGARKESH